MGHVETTIRASVAAGETLATPTGAAFVVERVDDEGVVLLLGMKQAWTRLTWSCLEGIPGFPATRGWTVIGGKYDVRGEPGTLDGYLKAYLVRATAGWVAALLERAGIVELDRARPGRVRLMASYP